MTINKSIIRQIRFNSHGDDRGELVALEIAKEIPFDVKRVYYIFHTAKGVSRGFHVHRSLKQVLVAVSGSVRVHYECINGQRGEVILSSPTCGLYIEGLVWRELHDFSSDAVLLVIADKIYDEGDYIRSYDNFILEKK